MWEHKGYELFYDLQKFKKMLIRAQAAADIPHPIFMAMRAIHCACSKDETVQGMKMSDISRMLGISRPASTQVVNELEKKGFVERILTKHDRRVVYVRMTEAGKEALKKGDVGFHLILKKLDELLGEQDMRELMRIIKKLGDALGEKAEEETSDSQEKSKNV